MFSRGENIQYSAAAWVTHSTVKDSFRPDRPDLLPVFTLAEPAR